MKYAIASILLVLGTCLVVPTGKADNAKLTDNEPIWGKTYTESYSGTETRHSYYFNVNSNDNISINTTVTNPYSQVWFGGLTDNNILPLNPFFFSSSSNNISGNGDAAARGFIDSNVNFWIVSGLDQIMMIVIRMYSTTSIQYTINKINATDPIIALQNQVNNLSMNLTNITSDLNSTKTRLSLLNDQLSQLSINESSDITRLQTLIESLNASLSQTITELWTAMGNNDTILMKQLVSNMTELTNQLSMLNSTLNDKIANIPKYNDTPIWDEINTIKQPINATFLNQTIVNQTVVNKTEVQPVTYINKTIENKPQPDYLTSVIVGIIGGIIGGFIMASVLIRRKKPEIVYMQNVEPPESLREHMLNVRKLQSQESESEVSVEDNLNRNVKTRKL